MKQEDMRMKARKLKLSEAGWKKLYSYFLTVKTHGIGPSSSLQLRNFMFLSQHTSFPLVLRSNVLLQGILLAFGTIEVLTVSSPGNIIVIPEETTLSQLGEQKIDDVLERLGEEGIGLNWY